MGTPPLSALRQKVCYCHLRPNFCHFHAVFPESRLLHAPVFERIHICLETPGYVFTGVCLSTGRRACVSGGVWQVACMVGGLHCGVMHGREACVAGRVCMAGGMCGRGCAWQGGMHGGGGACMAGETATAADGTHPTGMLSFSYDDSLFWTRLRYHISYVFFQLFTVRQRSCGKVVILQVSVSQYVIMGYVRYPSPRYQIWGPAPFSHQYCHLVVATEARTVCKRAVRILLENCLVHLCGLHFSITYLTVFQLFREICFHTSKNHQSKRQYLCRLRQIYE